GFARALLPATPRGLCSGSLFWGRRWDWLLPFPTGAKAGRTGIGCHGWWLGRLAAGWGCGWRGAVLRGLPRRATNQRKNENLTRTAMAQLFRLVFHIVPIGELQAQSAAELGFAFVGESYGARDSRLCDPLQLHHAFQQRCSQRTTEVMAALGEIEALGGQQTPPGA